MGLSISLRTAGRFFGWCRRNNRIAAGESSKAVNGGSHDFDVTKLPRLSVQKLADAIGITQKTPLALRILPPVMSE